MNTATLPATGFLRLKEIIGDKGDPKKNRPAITPLIPVSKTTWYDGIRTGIYPKGVKLSEKCVAWRAEDIRQLIEDMGGAK